MPYWESAPDPRLSRFVERICFSTDEGAPPTAPIRVVPDGRLDLIFSVACTAPSGGARPCRGEVFGTKTRRLLVESNAPVENVGVRFRPGAAPRLLGVAAHVLTDRGVAVDLLWGAHGAQLAERIGAAGDLAARRACLEEELLRRAAAARPDPSAGALEAALDEIDRAAGRLRVAVLARRIGVGERRLLRLFRERVGVPPKVFARIRRFQAALALLRGGAAQLDAALACGYSDQPHLLRDFAAFSGTSPGAYLREGARLSDSSKTTA